MKKRVVSALLAAAMCSSAVLTGCGGGGTAAVSDSSSTAGESSDSASAANSGERHNLTYTGAWCMSDYEDGSYVETMVEDALNLDIKVIKAENAEAIDVLLASGDMPDCAWLNKAPDWMEEQELTRTIPKAMVEEYAPSLIKVYDEFPLLYKQTLNPENEEEFRYLTGVTFQFTDYFLPNDYYRYDWIQKLGIDPGVEIEQVDEKIYVAKDGIEWSKFQEIMDGFVNGDPDGDGKADTVGATGSTLVDGPFLSAFNLCGGGISQEINGKAEMAYATEEYRDYLKGFAELYAKGLIDPEIISDNRTFSWEKVDKGIAGYWITSTNSLNSWAVGRPPLSLFEADPEATILMTPGIKPDGGTVQGNVGASPAYGTFYVRYDITDEEMVDILKFVEYTLFGAGDKDVHASMLLGEKGVDWEWNVEGESVNKLKNLQSGERGTWSFGQYGQDRDVTKWTGEEEMFTKGLGYWSMIDGVWKDYGKKPYKDDLAGETEYGAIRSEISGDLDAYVADYRVQAIMGKIDVDSTWEDYLAELDRLGYNKMMDELDKLEPLQDIIDSYN